VPILIDGHNLIGHLPAISLQDPDDEEKLIGLLRSYQARTGKAITVVFDPGASFALSQVHRYGGLEIVFAPQGSSADAVIARRVRRNRNPGGIKVVTSDRELAGAVTRHGARVQSAGSFASELSGLSDESPDWKDPQLSPTEVEAWMDLFKSQE
jgi:predicted RNA-binding protein with PIN domain